MVEVDRRFDLLIKGLRHRYGRRLPFEPERDLFRILITTIISQNTSGKLTALASSRFFTRFRAPEEVRRTSVKEIGETIRIAGLYRVKARLIKQLRNAGMRSRMRLDCPLGKLGRNCFRYPG